MAAYAPAACTSHPNRLMLVDNQPLAKGMAYWLPAQHP
ncbi:hypothetical protein EPYR_03594 [Erwinia pyrifoliae DSM 12163]|nr:hypothetical protein EPYR_03594 [Erwinia pyrifoliae DSM 12163]